jgi:hypothetical protein
MINSKQDMEVSRLLGNIAKERSAPPRRCSTTFGDKVIRAAVSQLNKNKRAYVFYHYQIETIKKKLSFDIIVEDMGSEVYQLRRK